jgi:hypothetical protein
VIIEGIKLVVVTGHGARFSALRNGRGENE